MIQAFLVVPAAYAQGVSNIESKWSSGDLIFYKKSDGSTVMQIGTNGVTIPVANITGVVSTGSGVNKVYGRNSANTADEMKSITGAGGIDINHTAGGIEIDGSGISGGGGFGGDGSDGAVTKGAATQSTPYIINATTFSQTASTTWTVEQHGQINCTGVATISGTITAFPCMWGGSPAGYNTWPAIGGHGAGPAPGVCGYPFSTISAGYEAAGSGGGCGGGGGRGGTGAESAGAQGGQSVAIHPGITGSGGGGSAKNGDIQRGGKGGTRFIIAAKGAITIDSGATINAKGQDGTGFEAGGGSGGVVGLFSETSITNSGTINVTGGNGGSGAGIGGGGGGAGWIVLMAPSITQGTLTVSGGTAPYTAAGAASGESSTPLIIEDVPTLPLIVWVIDHVEDVAKVAQINGKVSHDQLVALINSKSPVCYGGIK